MPKYPEFLARRFEAGGVPCTVDKIEDLSPRFRRLHVSGDGLRGHRWEPCQVTSFRVSSTEFRHYTPDSYDADAGTMSILFYRHGAGNGHRTPAETWLSAVAVGDPLALIMPGSAKRFRAIAQADGRYLLCGDGTTVGLWDSLIQWLPAGARVTGAVELPAADVELGRELLPGMDVLAETAEPGAALHARLADRGRPEVDHVYLSGHARTIQQLRTLLRTKHGVPKQIIYTHPYWATGKAGL